MLFLFYRESKDFSTLLSIINGQIDYDQLDPVATKFRKPNQDFSSTRRVKSPNTKNDNVVSSYSSARSPRDDNISQ